MSGAHAVVGQVAVILTMIATIWAIAMAITHRPLGSLFLGNLVWVAIAVVIAAALGAVTALAEGPPRDVLHVVYGVLALGTLPGAAIVATGRSVRQQAIVAAVAATILVILLFRLVQTGS
ncbi:MAG TPA: hypothetical protein VHM48_13845 [Candidatus Limnocylindrales bacterium]|nr:hypothetical protein [Candidatus Limnocylindrales bacterium]